MPGLAPAVLFLALVAAPAGPANAQGEHSRRAGAELRVVAGDIDRLITTPESTARHRGLIERIRGALAPMDILLRLADQEGGRAAGNYRTELARLSASLDAMDLITASQITNELIGQFPLEPLRTTVDSSINALALHNKLCAHCHDNPVSHVERPAYNLFTEARALPADEFLARMLIGVRGDRVTGIDNPLTDQQIDALITLYRRPQ